MPGGMSEMFTFTETDGVQVALSVLLFFLWFFGLEFFLFF